MTEHAISAGPKRKGVSGWSGTHQALCRSRELLCRMNVYPYLALTPEIGRGNARPYRSDLNPCGGRRADHRERARSRQRAAAE